ncbi:MAG: hypothetical protein ACPGSI_01150 [Pikeienuella sp.]
MNKIGNAVFIVMCLGIAGGGYYLANAGVWGVSTDVERSMRVGSFGGGYGSGGRVK